MPAPKLAGHSTAALAPVFSDNRLGGTALQPSVAGVEIVGDGNATLEGNVFGIGTGAENVGLPSAAIRIRSPFNVVGGATPGEENVISNSGGDAIQVLDAGSDDNEILRNRGAANGGLFIDLNDDGPDPATPAHDVNDGIGPPSITAVAHDGAAGTAAPGAIVRVFRKATAAPGEVAAFLGQATANGSGQWQVAYASLPTGTLVTASQTAGAPVGSTSELATPLASTAPPAPPGGEPPADPGDTSPPDTTIASGPKDKTKSKNATFAFNGTDARAVASFQCSLDGGAFGSCASPFTVKVRKGKHEFEVRAVDAAGNIDPTPASDTWKVKKKKRK